MGSLVGKLFLKSSIRSFYYSSSYFSIATSIFQTTWTVGEEVVQGNKISGVLLNVIDISPV